MCRPLPSGASPITTQTLQCWPTNLHSKLDYLLHSAPRLNSGLRGGQPRQVPAAGLLELLRLLGLHLPPQPAGPPAARPGLPQPGGHPQHHPCAAREVVRVRRRALGPLPGAGPGFILAVIFCLILWSACITRRSQHHAIAAREVVRVWRRALEPHPGAGACFLAVVLSHVCVVRAHFVRTAAEPYWGPSLLTLSVCLARCPYHHVYARKGMFKACPYFSSGLSLTMNVVPKVGLAKKSADRKRKVSVLGA